MEPLRAESNTSAVYSKNNTPPIKDKYLNYLRDYLCVNEAQARCEKAYECYSQFASSNLDDALRVVERVLETLTTTTQTPDSLPPPTAESLWGVIESVVCIQAHLKAADSLQSYIHQDFTLRNLLNYISDLCIGQDIAKDGPLLFAAAFLLDDFPEIFTQKDFSRRLSFGTSSLLCRLVFENHTNQPLTEELDALHERIGWIVAIDWLESNTQPEFGSCATHLRRLVVIELQKRTSELPLGHQFLFPLGWMCIEKTAHVMIGRFTKRMEGFELSIINPGEGAQQWHNAHKVPFSAYPSIEDTVTMSNISLDDAFQYLEQVISLSSSLKTQSPSEIVKQALEVLYGLRTNKVVCSSRSQIQRSPVCGVKVLKRLRKLYGSWQIQDKMYVLSLFWPTIRTTVLARHIINQLKHILLKNWLLSVIQKSSATQITALVNDYIARTKYIPGKVVAVAFYNIPEEGALKDFVQCILKSFPDWAIDFDHIAAG